MVKDTISQKNSFFDTHRCLYWLKRICFPPADGLHQSKCNKQVEKFETCDGDAGLVDVEWRGCIAAEEKWDNGSGGGRSCWLCEGMLVVL